MKNDNKILFYDDNASFRGESGTLYVMDDKLLFDGKRGTKYVFLISNIRRFIAREGMKTGIIFKRSIPNFVSFMCQNYYYFFYCGPEKAIELESVIKGDRPKAKVEPMIVQQVSKQPDKGFEHSEDFKGFKEFSINDIDAISSMRTSKYKGDLFERYCARLLELNLFSNIRVVGGTGDLGVDIVAWKGNKKVAIQCKCYAHTVPYAALEQIVTARKNVMASEAILLTNNYFSDQTKSIAPEHQVLLWDRRKLIQLIDTANEVCEQNKMSVVDESQIVIER